MIRTNQHVLAAAREVEAASTFPAIIVPTRSPDGAVSRMEVHLLDVPVERAFAAIGKIAELLDERVDGGHFLVFAHSREASGGVRARFEGRGVEVASRCPDTVEVPLIQDALSSMLEYWRSVRVGATDWDRGRDATLHATDLARLDSSSVFLWTAVPALHEVPYASVATQHGRWVTPMRTQLMDMFAKLIAPTVAVQPREQVLIAPIWDGAVAA